MAANDYHFITRWRVRSTLEEVSAILSNAEDLPRWWPAVYLDVKEVQPGDERGIGQVVALHSRGWLPYTIDWRFEITDSQHPKGYRLTAHGDFEGTGVWTFEPDGEWVDITYDWRIRADKPLVRRLSFLLKPVFAANHRWAMARGGESLELEIARRHARTAAEVATIPPPPAPMPTWPLPTFVAGIAIAAALVALRRPGR